MKEQGAKKKKLSTKVHRDEIHGNLWLEQQKLILMKFSMNIVKPVNILVSFHDKFSSSLGLVYIEEEVMSSILCAITIGCLLDAMK